MTDVAIAPNITALDFWNAFVPAVLVGNPTGYGTNWTTGMYDVFHDVQARLGELWCQCKRHPARVPLDGANGERLGIDFLWFRQRADGDPWWPPVVGIEHENGWGTNDRRPDCWKVGQLAVPLRVFIGYVRDADTLDAAAQDLKAIGLRWNGIEGGQDLIILGHGGMAHAGFRGWWRHQVGGVWQPLPAPP